MSSGPFTERLAGFMHEEGFVSMNTTAITIQVDTEVAQAYVDASPEEQRKMKLLLSLR